MWFVGGDEFVYLCVDMHSESIPRSRRTDGRHWIPCYRTQSLSKRKIKAQFDKGYLVISAYLHEMIK